MAIRNGQHTESSSIDCWRLAAYHHIIKYKGAINALYVKTGPASERIYIIWAAGGSTFITSSSAAPPRATVSIRACQTT
jgi:hypothetical protein